MSTQRAQKIASHLLLALYATGVLTLVSFTGTNASATERFQPIQAFTQFDVDADGLPERAQINCTCVTATDIITVYDRDGDMKPASDWQTGTDVQDDTWVFDISGDGRANLIVRFQERGGRQFADLYDDRDGDGAVAYRVVENRVQIDESQYWTLQAIATPFWYTADGKINANVQFLLDNPLVTELSSPEIAQKYMPHDGKPDVEYTQEDTNGDGVSEHFSKRVIGPVPWQYRVGRFTLHVNIPQHQQQRRATSLFWPFLDFQPIEGAELKASRYFDWQPSIAVDWQRSTISSVNLDGYPIGQGYHISSLRSVQLGQLNEPDYETPQAYYDLAQNSDAFPELHIRLFSPIIPEDETGRWQEVRYSWNQFNEGTLIWDYKLGMMDYHPIEDTVDYPRFSLRAVPYEQLPYWITGNTWRLTTFVARETGDAASSEGIYAWTPWQGVDPLAPTNPHDEVFTAATQYLAGTGSDSPAAFFNDIGRGYRGEYNFTRPLSSELYFSPVDRRLHLKGAEKGVLRLAQDHLLTYSNVDGDDYLDCWEESEQGRIVARLCHFGSFLIYGGGNEIIFQQIAPSASLFETLPPRDAAEWRRLGELLQHHGATFAASDLRAMVEQFDGARWALRGASLDSLRPTQRGFRLVVAMRQNAEVFGDAGLGPAGLQPGEQVVEYDGEFSVSPLTAAEVTLDLAFAGSQPFVDTRPSLLLVQGDNAGSQDQTNLVLSIFARHTNSEQEYILADEPVDMLAGLPLKRSLTWLPPTAGRWELKVRLSEPGGLVVSETSRVLEISASPPQTTPGAQSGALAYGPQSLFAVFGMFLFIAFGALVMRHVSQQRGRVNHNEYP